MKKQVLCLATVLLLGFSSPGVAFAAESLDSSDIATSYSLQLLYAQLQQAMPEKAQEQAMEQMAQIQAIQDEQKQGADYLNTARQLRAEAQDTGKVTAMPSDMAEYMDANGLAYDTTGHDLLMNADEWVTAITSLESRLEQLGAETQQGMVYLQDFMGQYNSYQQGANMQVSNSNQAINSLARGQSMYGDSGAGLTVTALVVGLVLGCVLTLAAQNLRRKKDKA